MKLIPLDRVLNPSITKITAQKGLWTSKALTMPFEISFLLTRMVSIPLKVFFIISEYEALENAIRDLQKPQRLVEKKFPSIISSTKLLKIFWTRLKKKHNKDNMLKEYLHLSNGMYSQHFSLTKCFYTTERIVRKLTFLLYYYQAKGQGKNLIKLASLQAQ